jgi:hypothetical protein
MKAIGIKESENEVETKLLSDMEPLEVCVVASGEYKNHIVMRTASEAIPEVMDLTDLKPNGYFGRNTTLRVKPYTGKEITLKLG